MAVPIVVMVFFSDYNRQSVCAGFSPGSVLDILMLIDTENF
jgi:hypothetical protein